MAERIGYLRTHRLQRRLLTLALAMLGGLAAAVLIYPRLSEKLLIDELSERDESLRAQAILRAVFAGRRSQRFVRRLEDALDTPDDVQFTSVVSVLRRLGRFNIPGRDPLYIDRIRALEISQTRIADDPQSAARTREILLTQVLLTGRRNRHVTAAAATARRDESPAVRRIGAILAAMHTDDDALRTLLVTDREPSVLATAALAAGMARRKSLAGELLTLFNSTDDLEVVSSAGFALALLDPKAYSRAICRKLRETDDEALRERGLHILTIVADRGARSTVAEILSESLVGGTLPSAGAITAATKLKVDEARAAIRAVAAAASNRDSPVRRSQVIAAFESAGTWKIDIHREAFEFCRTFWGPGLPRALTAATKAAISGARENEEPEIARMLRGGARYNRAAATQPATGPSVWISTPLPSAAAAAALWRIDHPGATDAIKHVLASDEALPGDYIAWELGATGSEDAFELGIQLLPPIGAALADGEHRERIHNDNILGTGAMLVALSARAPQQIALAVRGIKDRLERMDRNFYLEGTYRCALLILGQTEHLRKVRQLLGTNQFPQRRALTALLVTGDRYALDWALIPGRHRDEYVTRLLVDEGLADVLRICAGDLPTVDTYSERDLLKWQVRILRYAYALNRQSIEPGLKR